MRHTFMVPYQDGGREALQRFTDFLSSVGVKTSRPFKIQQPDGPYLVIMTEGASTEEMASHYEAWKELVCQ